MKRALLFGAFASVSALTIVPTAHSQSKAQANEAPLGIENAIELSPFGGRPNFSPDGRKIVFVDRSYGDAFEVDLATRQVRNLTAHLPNQGIVRIQYLPSGDFLVTAPRIHSGPNSRAHLEMWVLDKELRHGLQPLGQQAFEGIAISKSRNLIAWTVVEPELKPMENWQLAFARPTKRYIAEVSVEDGRATLTNQRQIMKVLPRACSFIEPQDFRDHDRELVYSCLGATKAGGVNISVMGNRIAEDSNIVYRRKANEYNEVEGIAPSGDWATVECGKQTKPGLPPLDICRLELKPNGKMTLLARGRSMGSTEDISNPVVSPNAVWLAFQKSDTASGEPGEGYGLYMIRLPN